MSDKQYLEAVTQFLDSHLVYVDESSYEETDNYWYLSVETNRRLSALKAQEDNIKSDMWEKQRTTLYEGTKKEGEK